MNIGLREIATWKIDANHKANERYFFQHDVVAHVLSGDAAIIIGRKGAGKTAIALHLVDEAGQPTRLGRSPTLT